MQSYKKVQKNKYGQNVGENLLHSQPLYFEQHSLTGRGVHLERFSKSGLTAQQSDQLWQIVQREPDARCWTYLPYPEFASQAQLEQRFATEFGFVQPMHYLVVIDQQCCGWLALLNCRSEQRVVEIGNVYFSSTLKQTCAATEAIYLLLKDCFEQGMRRVEWKCDELNTPSYRAALRFGFEYEGTFRQDRISKGRNRNTAWFSILDEEWLTLEKAYLQWLSPDNFDEQGQQKIRLSEFILTSRGE